MKLIDIIQVEDKPPRFTFQELVDMIEKGVEIPGKVKLVLIGIRQLIY
jgi:hypothetical protein